MGGKGEREEGVGRKEDGGGGAAILVMCTHLKTRFLAVHGGGGVQIRFAHY